jgi:hypothetical protein
VGWARANVLYDKHVGPPPRNSPLESVFLLVFIRRQEADLLATRALVRSMINLSESQELEEEAIKAFEDYCGKMFPFWKRAEDLEVDDQRQALMKIINKPLRINMPELYKTQAAALKMKAKRKQASQKARIPDRLKARVQP